MQTMKNKVGRKLAKSWLGKSLIRVRQKVDEVWMGIGQLSVRSWSAFKTKEVGQKLDKSWTDSRGNKLGQRSYKISTDFRGSSWQKWAKLGRNKLLQHYSSITPKITGQRLLQLFSNTSPEIEGSSLKRLSQQLPNDYLENKASSLNKSGQNQDEIGTENCVKVSLRFRQFEGYKVGQLLGETCVDLGPFYLEMSLVIQPLSFIAHSLIVHNKRVSCGYTEVTPALHQEFSLFDIASLFLYVVLPDQNL